MLTRSRVFRALAVLSVAGLGALALAARASHAREATPGDARVAAAPAPELEHAARAPLVVSYDQAATVLPSGETELTVHLLVRVPLAFPVALRASLPRGATLSDGQPDETLTLDRAGTVHRTFRFRTTEPLGAANPFRVVVHGEAPDHAMGLHADRLFPPSAEPAAAAPTAPGFRVPGGRPPAPLRR